MGEGRLLAARSEAGPGTWSKSFLQVAGRSKLLAARRKKGLGLSMMMVVEHAAGHQEGGWSTGLRAISPSVQCGTNIRISEYIKYI